MFSANLGGNAEGLQAAVRWAATNMLRIGISPEQVVVAIGLTYAPLLV